jgi:hypothetical protein
MTTCARLKAENFFFVHECTTICQFDGLENQCNWRCYENSNLIIIQSVISSLNENNQLQGYENLNTTSSSKIVCKHCAYQKNESSWKS